MSKPFRSFAFSLELIRLAILRLRYHFMLSVLSLLGVVLAVAIVSSAAFFAQGVDTVIMRQELADYSKSAGQPPLSTKLFAASSRTVPFNVQRIEELGSHVADTLSSEVGLPVRAQTVMMASGVMHLRPRADDTRYTDKKNIADFGVNIFSQVAEHLDIVEGAPLDDGASKDALDVWIYADQATKFGLQIGELYELTGSDLSQPLSIRIAGSWHPKDPENHEFWFSDPSMTLQDKLLVRHDDYVHLVEPNLTVGVRAATWYIILDELQAVPSSAQKYVDGFTTAARVIKGYVPGAQMTTPSLSLSKFVGRQTTLATVLLGFNTPALAFLLYFLALTSAVIAYWSRRESAILLSRGMTRWGILSSTVAEVLILVAIGLPLGLLAGLAVARGMGYTTNFLQFIWRSPLPVSFTNLNWPLVVAALALILLVRVWMAAAVSGDTVVSQEREHARPLKGPFWYRAYLDLILLIPAVYGYQQLAQRGTFSALVKEQPEEIFKDPLLIVAPALMGVVGSLLAMRIFPWLMMLLDWLAERVTGLPSHLALRQLARYSQSYINPMLLVIVSLSLGVYSHALAASLDQWLIDRVSYRTGADLTFEPFDWALVSGDKPTLGADWVPPPSEFAALPGVAAATRFGDYRANIKVAAGDGKVVSGRFIALDRAEFARVSWFRPDFASEPLGGLMNRLAATPEGILVSESFLKANNLRAGDKLEIYVLADGGASLTDQFTVVGAYRYFPTVYEQEKVAVIGNFEYINSFFGMTMPHHLWLKLKPGARGEDVVKSIPETGIDAISVEDTPAILTDERGKMERVGVFGTLSVGFLASALMAALGLLTHTYSSLNERLYLFSVMRAIGLKRIQVLLQVGLEYTLLIAYAGFAGVTIGTISTQLFVPLFRVSGDPGKALPPLLPILDQTQVIPLVAIFTLGIIFLELLIIRTAIYQRLGQALRLGHQG
ncbi:MAG: ABC transporter permease [Caldilineaceae bacterium]